MGVIVRPARVEDIEAIARVHDSAFPHGDAERHRRELVGLWPAYLVLEADGEVVGLARVVRETLQLGPRATVVKADVGHVGILADRQGEGLGTQLMQGVVRHLREQGIPLSRLGGYQPFYARFGYVPFPRRFYHFPIEPAQAGAATLPPERFLATAPEHEPHLRPYHPARDGRARARLERAFNNGRTGAYAPAGDGAEDGEPDTTGRRWVYAEGDRLLGCVATFVHETTATITGAFDLTRPEAVAPLVRRLLLELHQQRMSEVLGRLPFDPRLEDALVVGGVGYIRREVCTAPAGNMLLLADLPAFVAAACPAWSAALTECPPGWRGALGFAVGEQTASLGIGADDCTPEAPGPGMITLRLAPRDFLLLALGYRSLSEVHWSSEDTLPEALVAMLEHLFRRRPTATGPLG